MSDDLDEHAAAHCSHLSQSLADWRSKMRSAILDYGLPLSEGDRMVIYEASRIPRNIYEKLDLQVFQTALGEKNARIFKDTE
jgi:hypothetical protein